MTTNDNIDPVENDATDPELEEFARSKSEGDDWREHDYEGEDLFNESSELDNQYNDPEDDQSLRGKETDDESPTDDEDDTSKQDATTKKTDKEEEQEAFDLNKSLLKDSNIELPEDLKAKSEVADLRFDNETPVLLPSGDKIPLNVAISGYVDSRAVAETLEKTIALYESIADAMDEELGPAPDVEAVRRGDPEARDEYNAWSLQRDQNQAILNKIGTQTNKLVEANKELKKEEDRKQILRAYDTLLSDIPELKSEEVQTQVLTNLFKAGKEIGGLSKDEVNEAILKSAGVFKVFMAASNYLEQAKVPRGLKKTVGKASGDTKVAGNPNKKITYKRYDDDNMDLGSYLEAQFNHDQAVNNARR